MLLNNSIFHGENNSRFENLSHFLTRKNGSDFSSGDNASCQKENDVCRPGIVIPLWLPELADHPAGPTTYRAVVYGIALIYLLFGVSIITERIVECAEVIVSHKVLVTRILSNGTKKSTKEYLWHHTVAFLTFQVIGTSSPEILLTLIQTFRHDFHVEELGATLIIGSSAYHLFIITAVCLFATKESSGKPIKDLYLFFTTGAFALLGTIWVYLVLDRISPSIIELWEAIITLALFPALVFCAWAMASRYPHKLIHYFSRLLRGDTVSPSANFHQEGDDDDGDHSSRRKKAARRLKSLKKKFPEKPQTELEAIVQTEIIQSAPKSRAFYRLKATTAISANGAGGKKQSLREVLAARKRSLNEARTTQTVGFQNARVSCHESCGSVSLMVDRAGAGVMEKPLIIHYATIQATAKAEKNFKPVHNGVITFEPRQTIADVVINILSDGVYEEQAKFFQVKLFNPSVHRPRAAMIGDILSHKPQFHTESLNNGDNLRIRFTTPEVTVSILDDDHCGVFSFEQTEQAVSDNVGTAKIKVIRSVGTKCDVDIYYRISPGTAKLNEDYIVTRTEGKLHFGDGDYEKFIEVQIVDKDRCGEMFNFHVELFPPRRQSVTEESVHLGIARLGQPNIIQIGICENEEMKQTLDRLLKAPEIPTYVVSSTWRDQIHTVFVVSLDDLPSSVSPAKRIFLVTITYFMHIISFPWKLCVAILPPARLMHGYISYFSLLVLMGIVASLIGDCASLFACTVGLKETVTAITLVPFGMGLPDTFASLYAAVNEKTADAAIGGIMGSNAVSVFFGIGLSWTICATVAVTKGEKVTMPATSFGFSVIIFCVFAAIGLLVLLLRRLPPVRGELGGPNAAKYLSASFFLLLWALFVTLYILESHCIIKNFLL